jgi:hypothetical protein
MVFGKENQARFSESTDTNVLPSRAEKYGVTRREKAFFLSRGSNANNG